MSCITILLFVVASLALAECSNVEQNEGEQYASCPSYQTDCGTGCCPLPNAVCCAGGYTCCRQGAVCVLSILCIGYSPSNQTLYSENTHQLSVASSPSISLCLSGSTQCGAGCCPLPSAVCCSDGVHCCPNSYRCDYSAGGCVRNKLFTPFLEKRCFKHF